MPSRSRVPRSERKTGTLNVAFALTIFLTTLLMTGRLATPQNPLDRHEVTNAEFARFVTDTGRPPPAHWGGGRPVPEMAEEPVILVTYHDAEAYCAWAGKKRLPTVPEWQRACQAGSVEKLGWVWEWTSTPSSRPGEEAFRMLCGPTIERASCDCSHSYHPTWKNAVKGFRCASGLPVARRALLPPNDDHPNEND